MSFFTTTILLGLLTAGSLLLRHDLSRADEFVRFASGRIEKVTVLNGKSYYCPYGCRVNHRHLVHEVELPCDDFYSCTHYVVTYGNRGEEQKMPTPPPLADGRTMAGTVAEKPRPNP